MIWTTLLTLSIFTLIAIVVDIASYHFRAQKNGYNPNLHVWSWGFLVGICALCVQMLSNSILKVGTTPNGGEQQLILNMALIFTPAVLIIVLTYGIIRICHHD